MTIKLTKRQFGHLVGHIERNGYDYIFGGLSINRFDLNQLLDTPRWGLGDAWYYASGNEYYSLEINAVLTSSEWLALIKRIEEI